MKKDSEDITKRTPREVAAKICELYSREEVIKIVLECDAQIAEYPFTFSVVKSLIHDAIDEDVFSKKEIDKKISEATLYKKY
jgi:hypothetical protein